MKTTETKHKARVIKSFEAMPDVARMLEDAQRHGLKVCDILNRLCRIYGHIVIADIASERRESLADFGSGYQSHLRLAA